MRKKEQARRSAKSNDGVEVAVTQTAPPPVVDPFRVLESSLPMGLDSPSDEVAQVGHPREPAPQARRDEAPESLLALVRHENESAPALDPAPFELPSEVSRALADEASVPPVSDWDSAFFSDPFAAAAAEDGVDDAYSQRLAMFRAASERRAHLARYVVGAVAVSAALCLIALAKVAIVGAGGSASASTSAGEATHGNQAQAVALALPRAASDAPSIEPPAPSSVAAPPAAPGPSSTPTALAAPPRETAPAPPMEIVGPSEARQRGAMREREASRSALERNNFGGAVGAGERSVELDPTDGEAWLILGAAYQARGDLANARRCYRACVAQGKRGPRGECAGLLR